MELAETFAKRSHDIETQVGSILIHKKTGALMGGGFNGFVRGAPDGRLPITRETGKHDFIIHSEQNLIYNAARHGVSTSDCFVVCTLSPCVNCLRALFQADIHEIYYKTTYKDFDKSINMGDLDVDLTELEGYTKIELRRKQ